MAEGEATALQFTPDGVNVAVEQEGALGVQPKISEWDTIIGIIRCPVCLDLRFRPRILQCGHSVCENCLEVLHLRVTNGEVSCPLCRGSQRLPDNGVAGFPVNFAQRDVQSLALEHLQSLALEHQGPPPMEQRLAQNEAVVGRGMLYNFCILSDGNSNALSEAVIAILDQLEREQIDGNFVKGYWHDRDATIGQAIIENITNSIQNSRFILLLIHPINIRNEWWKRSRFMALTHKLSNPEMENTVIPIFVDDQNDPLPHARDIPLFLQGLHGLRYDNEEFWRELKELILGRENEIDLR